MIPSWNIGTTSNLNFVNDMLDDSTKLLIEDEYPLIHANQVIIVVIQTKLFRWKK